MSDKFMDWVVSAKGGKGSGNFHHAGRPSKVGGSRTDTDAEHLRKNAAEIIERMRQGGFTFRPGKGFKEVFKDKGYCVAIKGHQAAYGPDEFNADKLMDYYFKNRRALRKNKQLYLGGWVDGESGYFVLDLSVVVKSKQAMTLAVKHDQVAIFDLFTATEIPVNRGKKIVLGEENG